MPHCVQLFYHYLSHYSCMHDRLRWGQSSSTSTAAISPIDSEQQQQEQQLSILTPEQLAEQFSAQIEAALQSPPHAISMMTPPLSPLTPFNTKRQSRGHFKYEVSDSSSNSSKSILSSVRRVLLGSPQARI
eukprot:5318-Heterococcus_DN1.PRE.3